jgi:hypothetical protein
MSHQQRFRWVDHTPSPPFDDNCPTSFNTPAFPSFNGPSFEHKHVAYVPPFNPLPNGSLFQLCGLQMEMSACS